MNRVVITGLGAISPLGLSCKALWDGCLLGESVVSPIPSRWRTYHKFRSTIWAPLPFIDYASLGFSKLEILQRDPISLLAIASSREALDHAGFVLRPAEHHANTYELEDVDPERIGVYFGTGVGGSTSLCDQYVTHVLGHARSSLEKVTADDHNLATLVEDSRWAHRINPFVVPRTMPNTAAASVSIKFRLNGPSHTFCQACASGTVAIGQAYRAIQNSEADIAVAGGAEFFSDRLGGLVMSFDISRTLVQSCDPPGRANRPFDAQRSGFLISQGGAAAVVLESLQSARANGHRILAEVIGYGETCDAHSMMALTEDHVQMRRMIQVALRDADLAAAEVDYINAHGTGTETNDKHEGALLTELFGDIPYVNSTKGIIGHSIGASGAFETVVTVNSLVEQRMHPCANLDNPISPLRFVRSSKKASIEVAMTHSFGFGGHNAGLILTRA